MCWDACGLYVGVLLFHECIHSDVDELFCVPESWWNKVALVDIVYTSWCPRGLVDSLICCHSLCVFVQLLIAWGALCTI